ncbi:hypothetical protein B0H12DRAFT_1069030 [Mycena haematopus]|nr:hypothetical protein B0H12DRAFT_1069030 [Mycena haematopus]
MCDVKPPRRSNGVLKARAPHLYTVPLPSDSFGVQRHSRAHPNIRHRTSSSSLYRGSAIQPACPAPRASTMLWLARKIRALLLRYTRLDSLQERETSDLTSDPLSLRRRRPVGAPQRRRWGPQVEGESTFTPGVGHQLREHKPRCKRRRSGAHEGIRCAYEPRHQLENKRAMPGSSQPKELQLALRSLHKSRPRAMEMSRSVCEISSTRVLDVALHTAFREQRLWTSNYGVFGAANCRSAELRNILKGLHSPIVEFE